MRVGLGWLLLLMLVLAGGVLKAAEDAPLLAQRPTLSKTSIVFVYGGYLWSVPRDGGEARIGRTEARSALCRADRATAHAS